ncbi:ATP phosphoribosyltransferase [Cohaesibacter sp. CAU 1516]|uniref:ATP phosphoribosyltransferase n=1 Tax=Cohaesibacter sp. CAU 1516 TaxID=2576038 RepID=UPI0010FDB96C|nr:ATP phosphoribosyltransferase [Cohaesibacter sp. CAU 1516]TLP45616.1 ATP phosphoribosyltransferase [Cohaesibacter sp. CAU 1516]
MSKSPLIIAVPSKGRLQENANAFFARAGLKVARPGGARNYRGHLKGIDNVEIAFLSASEIAKELKAGSVHLGVTGEDLIREHLTTPERYVDLLIKLGFGHANVVIALPKAWIDVRTMEDLGDVAIDMPARYGHRLRVATKYINLTRSFFASHGIVDYKIVESLGATEGAPAAGSADVIVDITSTGSTLEANNLKILDDGVILRSEANLVASLTADWSEEARLALSEILDRIQAEEAARTRREITAAHFDAASVSQQICDEFADANVYAPLGHGEGFVTLHAPEGFVYPIAARLRALGATEVSVKSLDYIFEASNPLFDHLIARLDD